MNPKNALFIFVILAGVFAFLYFSKPSGHNQELKAQLKAIQQEKEALAVLLQNSRMRQTQLQDSIYNRVEDNKLLRRLNEATNARLNREKQRTQAYEKQLDSILFYTDAVMDSLYRARYPHPDSIRNPRTAPGMD